jgi:ABC-type polysaccharide/polyol phosphate transport system ATPase subunit
VKPASNNSVGGIVEDVGRRRYALALDDLSLKMESGDRIGIVGSNGSGKSTLLRLLAGIYRPDHGRLVVAGKVSTLFSTSIGMSVNESSRQNIRDVALLMGIDQRKLKSIEDDVIDFAEVEDFADAPMRALSTGMRARVGFGVATALEPEILLIDEVMGTGDLAFQEKARNRVDNLIGKAGIVVVASHSISLLRHFTSNLIWMKQGSIKEFGATDTIIQRYKG